MAQIGLADYYVRQSYGDTTPGHAIGASNVTSPGNVKDAGDIYPDTFLGRLNRRFGKSRAGMPAATALRHIHVHTQPRPCVAGGNIL